MTFSGCSEIYENTFISWRTGDISGFPDFLGSDSPEECRQLCFDNPQCVAWNFHKDFGCNLKSKNNGKKSYPGWLSGTTEGCTQGDYCMF